MSDVRGEGATTTLGRNSQRPLTITSSISDRRALLDVRIRGAGSASFVLCYSLRSLMLEFTNAALISGAAGRANHLLSVELSCRAPKHRLILISSSKEWAQPWRIQHNQAAQHEQK